MELKASKKDRLIINPLASILNEIVSIISGLIVPRMILLNFGSRINGLTSSIVNFLGMIALVRSGIGGVTKVHLYKALKDNNKKQLNVIMKSTNDFMKRVSLFFVCGLILLSIIYPFFVIKEYDWLFTFSLVLIIGISSFCENYFGFSYQIVLQADQREYIISIVNIFVTILNVVVALILINFNCSIRIIKLGSSLVFAIKPILINIYAKSHYGFHNDVMGDETLLSQREDAFIHTLAEFIHLNTDTILLAIFVSTLEISVYSVYILIINGLRKVLRALTSNLEAVLGRLKNSNENKYIVFFEIFTVIVGVLSGIVFTCFGFLAIPFIKIYTDGVNDVDYIRISFLIIMAISEFFYEFRLPAQFAIRVNGCFKETKNIFVFEAIINILFSLILIRKQGIVGVAIGTLIAMFVSTTLQFLYTSKNLVKTAFVLYIKVILSNLISFSIILVMSHIFNLSEIMINNYFQWAIYSMCFFITSFLIFVLISLVINHKYYNYIVVRRFGVYSINR